MNERKDDENEEKQIVCPRPFSIPADGMLRFGSCGHRPHPGTPQALKERALADIRTVRSELLKPLQPAGFSEPADPDAGGATGATGATGAAGATANEVGAYRVIVCDADGNPVEGAVVQLCDDTTCSLQKTKADGVATFQVKTPKVYEVHVAKVPEGYVSSDETYETLDTWSDVNITVSRAE